MINYLLIFAVYFTAIYSMEPNAKFVVGLQNKANKELRVKIIGPNKAMIFDRTLRPNDGTEKVLSPQESPIILEVYDIQRLEFADKIDLKALNMPYFDVAKKESGLGFIIKNDTGKITVTKDLNYFGTPKPVKLQPTAKPAPAAPVILKPTAKPSAAQPAPSTEHYEIAIKNFWYAPVRIEVIGARAGKAAQGNMLVNQPLGRNEEFQQSFDTNVFPIALRVYINERGIEKLRLEDEINLPALKLNHFEFYVVNDRKHDGEATLQFVPDVPHGPAIKQKNIEPAVQQKFSQPTTAQPSTTQSTKPMPVRYDKYEVNLAHGSRLPLRYRLVTSSGRVLFEGTVPGASPTERKYPSTPLYQVLPSDFPLKVYSFDDSGMSGNFEFNFSLDQALSESANIRKKLAHARSVTFGNGNQFTITVDDSRPTRTGPGHTHSRISALTQ